MNPMQMLMSLASQCGNNPQAFAQKILQQNPDFAKAIQGQNPQSMAMNMIQRSGLNPQQIMQMFGKR